MGFWKLPPRSSWLNSGTQPQGGGPPATPDVATLRGQVLAALGDCTGHRADALRLRLQRAPGAQELWLARCEVYQLVASQHCESQAAMRINALLPAFRPWLPAKVLVTV